MLPSRGLRPAQLQISASRHPITSRSTASRKFSSLPRTAGLSPPSCRASPLQSARWRTGATRNSNIVLTASSVRNGSWYAPWSWGKSSTSSADASVPGTDQVPIAEISSSTTSKVLEPVVTSATPELAPAGIDKAPVVNSTAGSTNGIVDSQSSVSKTMDELLTLEPTKDAIPTADFDPTALVNHTGHLQELGLEYGWGMTTMFEKTIEQIYLQSGWGWAGSIMLAAVAVRGATFFFQVLSSDRMAALAALKPITEPIQKKMEDAIARGDKQQEQIYKMQQAQIMRPYMGGVFSMGGFMIMQGWIGFCAFRFLRAMADMPVPGMGKDGFFWFADLTVRDPYFILPAATTGIFYAIFKAGGETGVSNDLGSSAETRRKLMTGMAFILGAVTAFQAAALQLYFLASGLLGAGTGWLLRQNGFRRFIHIRPLPSKESTELYTKVVEGKVKLSDIQKKHGKPRYQAPSIAKAPINRRGLSGINLKAGTALPLHLQPEAPKTIEATSPSGLQDRDVDFEIGPQGTITQKMDYYRRNYKLRFMFRRTSAAMEGFIRKAGYGGKKMTEQQEKRKRRAEQYELERRRRFENRK